MPTQPDSALPESLNMPPIPEQKDNARVWSHSDSKTLQYRSKPVASTNMRRRASGRRRLDDLFRELPLADQILNMRPSAPPRVKADFTDDESDEDDGDDEDNLEIAEQDGSTSAINSYDTSEVTEDAHDSFEVREEVDDTIDDAELERLVTEDPRFERNRIRFAKKIRHIAARAECDGEPWNGKSDEELGDILLKDTGGYFELIPDSDGRIDMEIDENGWYVDKKDNVLLQPVFPRMEFVKDKDGKIEEKLVASDKIIVKAVKRPLDHPSNKDQPQNKKARAAAE